MKHILPGHLVSSYLITHSLYIKENVEIQERYNSQIQQKLQQLIFTQKVRVGQKSETRGHPAVIIQSRSSPIENVKHM